MMFKKGKVLLGMSGGLDSTVAAVLLQKDGYDVVGVYMKLHHKEGYHEENYEKAKKIANYLGIDVHFLDLSKEFKDDVYDYFVQSYKDGLTPNPCVMCNRTIKFGKMIEFADSLNIDKISTGHYCKCDGNYIYMARDETKDQSYFLCEVDKKVLPRLIFPLGDLLKDDIREYASNIEILKSFAKQKESTEICFVENSYDEVLAKYMDIDIAGDTVDKDGNVVGTHKGYMHYTIGKRRGFTVDGAHDPHFVLEIKPKENQIVVGKKEELAENSFYIKDINMFEELKEFKSMVKVRFRTRAVACSVKIEDDKAKVILDEPVYGLAKGQISAFYMEDRLIGGGVIC